MPDIEGESDAEDRALSVGNNFGNLQNDNKNINNSRVEHGNITIHNHKTNCTLPVVCITIVAVLLLAVIALFIHKSSETIQKLPPSNHRMKQTERRQGENPE